jgi:tetratricopeptide (TPR) repeat protein
MRLALSCALAVLASAPLAAAPAPKDGPKSLVGRPVLLRLPNTYGRADVPVARAPGGPPALPGPWRPLTDLAYTVREEKGARVRVLDDDGTSVWLEREQFVPLAEAVDFFAAQVKANPGLAHAHNSLGWAYHLQGKPEQAAAALSEGVRLLGFNYSVLTTRGLVFSEAGRHTEALRDLDRAVEVAPRSATARLNRGVAHERAGHYPAAVVDYQRATELSESFALAWNNLAWVRAASPDAKVRDGTAAVEFARRAVRLSGGADGMYLDTLAAAYAEAGRFDEAVKAQQSALADPAYLAREGDDARERLRLYQAKQPFRMAPVQK